MATRTNGGIRWTKHKKIEELLDDPLVEEVYGLFLQVKDSLITAAKAVTGHDLRRFVTLSRGMENFDVTDRLDAIQCPTLAIGSADDTVLGSDAICDITEKLKDKPGFQSYVYDGYGHAAFDAAPDYQERILRFFLEN